MFTVVPKMHYQQYADISQCCHCCHFLLSMSLAHKDCIFSHEVRQLQYDNDNENISNAPPTVDRRRIT